MITVEQHLWVLVYSAMHVTMRFLLCSAAPSMSVDTGFPRQLPAASGPAVSIDSGGKSSRKPFVLKLKTSFLGAPSKSQRTSAPEGEHPSQPSCRLPWQQLIIL